MPAQVHLQYYTPARGRATEVPSLDNGGGGGGGGYMITQDYVSQRLCFNYLSLVDSQIAVLLSLLPPFQ